MHGDEDASYSLNLPSVLEYSAMTKRQRVPFTVNWLAVCRSACLSTTCFLGEVVRNLLSIA